MDSSIVTSFNEVLAPVVAAMSAVFAAYALLSRFLVDRVRSKEPREAARKIKPIAGVLIGFAALLAITIVIHLVLYWRDLKTIEDKDGFLRALAYGLFLFLVMVAGMFARYFWELFQSGKEWHDAALKTLLLPLLVSLMVFYPLWTIASGAPRNFFAIVAAFQNGFFWQTVFSGLKPFDAAPPPVAPPATPSTKAFQ